MTIPEAVKEVRRAMERKSEGGVTQEQFARLFDTTVRTIARYEREAPSSPDVLHRFKRLAQALNRPDLADVFQPQRIYRPEGLKIHDAVESILYLGGSANKKARAALTKITEPIVEANRRADAEARALRGITDEINRRVDSGESNETIVSALHDAPEDTVRILANNRREMNRLGRTSEGNEK